MTIDYTDPAIATQIASVSSASIEIIKTSPGRWTEIHVYWLHNPPAEARRKPWIAVVEGRSSLPGEDQKVTTSARRTLEHALGTIHDSALGRAAKDQARDWVNRNSGAIMQRNVLNAMVEGDEALTGPKLAETMRAALARYDAVTKACPANAQFLGTKPCPRCAAKPSVNCGEGVLAGYALVETLREALEQEAADA